MLFSCRVLLLCYYCEISMRNSLMENVRKLEEYRR